MSSTRLGHRYASDPLELHPCYSHSAHGRYGRVHLPVAPRCNISCKYCDRRVSECCRISRPGVSARILNPTEALDTIRDAVRTEPRIRVVGIAGPGEPLYNQETLETLSLVHDDYPELILCLSTNGLLLPRYVSTIADLGVKTCTVTVNTVNPDVGSKIYSHIKLDDTALRGEEAARTLISNQLEGIVMAVEAGIIVKVNTVLIPGINSDGIVDVAREVKSRGAYIQNIMLLIPLGEFSDLRPPSCEELRKARHSCEKMIPQFRLCKQCRADAIGIPGQRKSLVT